MANATSGIEDTQLQYDESNDGMPQNSDAMKRPEVSRHEAISKAIDFITIAHGILALVTWATCILVMGVSGIMPGLLMVVVLLAAYVFFVLPAGNVIGWIAHRLFEHSSISIIFAIRTFILLFELNLFGWICTVIFDISTH